MGKQLLAVMVVELFAASQVLQAASVLYVDDDAPPGGNGKTWGTATTV